VAARTRLIKQPKMSFWVAIYFPAIFQGLGLTAWHFSKNLSLHILHRFGLFKDIPASVTYQYPEEKRPLAHRYRSRHRLTQRQDGSPRCVACMMCETVCPAHCIYIVADEHPDPNIEKRPRRFDIDLGICVYCGFCVEACPEDAIRMDTKIVDISAYSREGMYLTMDDLLHPENHGAIVLRDPKRPQPALP